MRELLQAVEYFHLSFLRAFSARVDKRLWALKGGCNLRFFHRSIRYSEDMDLDIKILARETLRKNVAAILDSTALGAGLRLKGIELTGWSDPKQTDTVQRWKMRLRLPGRGLEAPTKIEFSRRGLDAGAACAVILPEILNEHMLPVFLASHYARDAAIRQKIGALAHRAETQARDIFDLNLLLDAGGRPPPDLGESLRLQAVERAQMVGHEDFLSQVVAFLPPDWQDHYRDASAWDLILRRVVVSLTRAGT
ncbi:MAG: nucleotidyl transferase AbiEii/AbiGii toxin family protein [Kiritimatiellia bacterium]